MATRKQKTTSDAKAAPLPVEPSPEVKQAEALLDRLRQQATAGRDRMAWQQYQGACEMARRLSYTVHLVGERTHILIEIQ